MGERSDDPDSVCGQSIPTTRSRPKGSIILPPIQGAVPKTKERKRKKKHSELFKSSKDQQLSSTAKWTSYRENECYSYSNAAFCDDDTEQQGMNEHIATHTNTHNLSRNISKISYLSAFPFHLNDPPTLKLTSSTYVISYFSLFSSSVFVTFDFAFIYVSKKKLLV